MLFGLDVLMRNCLSILKEKGHGRAEIATKSRLTLAVIGNARQWALPMITSIKRQLKHVEDGCGRGVLVWLSDYNNEGYKIADTAAQ